MQAPQVLLVQRCKAVKCFHVNAANFAKSLYRTNQKSQGYNYFLLQP